jgi:GT2 family glycosyltransferase
VAQAFPWVQLIASDENLGFTRGNNAGYAQSRGRFVYFLNPDTEVVNDRAHGDSLARLFATVRDNATIGMAGPMLRYADNSLQVSVRRFPEPMTGFFESTWLGRLWRRNPWSRRMHMADWQVDYAHDVDWLVGAALLCRREAMQSIMGEGDTGPFDEGYFMYSEEQDLALRLRLQGWRVVWQPSAVVIHFEGRSSEQAVAARHLSFNTSKVRYWRKWFGPRWSEALRRYLLLEYRGQIVLERSKWLLGHKRSMRAQRIEVYRQVIRSRLTGD